MTSPGNWGVTDIPVVLILCIFLAAIAVGMGVEGLSRTKNLEDKQKSIRSFDRLIEVGTDVSYGGIGGRGKVRLDLGARRIVVKGNLVQLKGGEVLKAEYLPFPLFKEERDNFEIRNGTFLLTLGRSDGKLEGGGRNQLVLELERIA